MSSSSTSSSYSSRTVLQQILVAFIPKVSSSLSIIGSTWIIIEISTDKYKRKNVYQRLMLSMSIIDFIRSCTLFASTWPIPAMSSDYNDGLVWNHGNDTTCTIQGFFIQLSIACPIYSACLAFYYQLIVQFHWKESQIRLRIEPMMHFISIAIAIGTSVVGIDLNMYHNDHNLWCWIASYPYNCNEDDDAIEDEELSSSSSSIPCTENANASVYRWAFFYGIVITCFVISLFCLMSVYFTMRKRERNAFQDTQQNNGTYNDDVDDLPSEAFRRLSKIPSNSSKHNHNNNNFLTLMPTTMEEQQEQEQDGNSSSNSRHSKQHNNKNNSTPRQLPSSSTTTGGGSSSHKSNNIGNASTSSEFMNVFVPPPDFIRRVTSDISILSEFLSSNHVTTTFPTKGMAGSSSNYSGSGTTSTRRTAQSRTPMPPPSLSPTGTGVGGVPRTRFPTQRGISTDSSSLFSKDNIRSQMTSLSSHMSGDNGTRGNQNNPRSIPIPPPPPPPSMTTMTATTSKEMIRMQMKAIAPGKTSGGGKALDDEDDDDDDDELQKHMTMTSPPAAPKSILKHTTSPTSSLNELGTAMIPAVASNGLHSTRPTTRRANSPTPRSRTHSPTPRPPRAYSPTRSPRRGNSPTRRKDYSPSRSPTRGNSPTPSSPRGNSPTRRKDYSARVPRLSDGTISSRPRTIIPPFLGLNRAGTGTVGEISRSTSSSFWPSIPSFRRQGTGDGRFGFGSSFKKNHTATNKSNLSLISDGGAAAEAAASRQREALRQKELQDAYRVNLVLRQIKSSPHLSAAVNAYGSRAIFYQSMWYIVTFYITYCFATVNHLFRFGTGREVYSIVLLHVLFFPMQGLFNFIVYRYSYYIRLRNQYPHHRKWETIQRVFRWTFLGPPKEKDRQSGVLSNTTDRGGGDSMVQINNNNNQQPEQPQDQPGQQPTSTTPTMRRASDLSLLRDSDDEASCEEDEEENGGDVLGGLPPGSDQGNDSQAVMQTMHDIFSSYMDYPNLLVSDGFDDRPVMNCLEDEFAIPLPTVSNNHMENDFHGSFVQTYEDTAMMDAGNMSVGTFPSMVASTSATYSANSKSSPIFSPKKLVAGNKKFMPVGTFPSMMVASTSATYSANSKNSPRVSPKKAVVGNKKFNSSFTFQSMSMAGLQPVQLVEQEIEDDIPSSDFINAGFQDSVKLSSSGFFVMDTTLPVPPTTGKTIDDDDDGLHDVPQPNLTRRGSSSSSSG